MDSVLTALTLAPPSREKAEILDGETADIAQIFLPAPPLNEPKSIWPVVKRLAAGLTQPKKLIGKADPVMLPDHCSFEDVPLNDSDIVPS